jgi:hypothetical protein
MAARVRPDTVETAPKRWHPVTNGSVVKRGKLTITFDDAGIRDNLGNMSFRVELAAGRRRQPRCSATGSSDVACVEGAIKGGRSPAKRTLEGVRNANTLRGLGLLALFSGQRPSPSGGKDFTALGGGVRGGAPAGLGRGIRITGVGSTQNDLSPRRVYVV